MGVTYTCSVCDGSFESIWTEGHAREEYIKKFGVPPTESETGVVCDVCYNKILEWEAREIKAGRPPWARN